MQRFVTAASLCVNANLMETNGRPRGGVGRASNNVNVVFTFYDEKIESNYPQFIHLQADRIQSLNNRFTTQQNSVI